MIDANPKILASSLGLAYKCMCAHICARSYVKICMPRLVPTSSRMHVFSRVHCAAWCLMMRTSTTDSATVRVGEKQMKIYNPHWGMSRTKYISLKTRDVPLMVSWYTKQVVHQRDRLLFPWMHATFTCRARASAVYFHGIQTQESPLKHTKVSYQLGKSCSLERGTQGSLLRPKQRHLGTWTWKRYREYRVCDVLHPRNRPNMYASLTVSGHTHMTHPNEHDV